MSRFANIDFSKRHFKKMLVSFIKQKTIVQQDLDFVFKKLVESKKGEPAFLNYTLLFSDMLDLKPAFGKKHLSEIVKLLEDDTNKTFNRVLFRYLAAIHIPTKLEGKVLDICLNALQDMQTPIANKVFAMTTAFNIAKKHPTILVELKEIIAYQIPHSSAGFRSRGKKIIQEINTVQS